MTNATFHNFTDQPFTGYWNGKAKTFKPGYRELMPRYLAEHFAKHLTNSVLMEMDKKDGVSANYTSPKNPGQVHQFMDVFNKAFIADATSDGQDEIDAEISAAKPKGPSANIDVVQPTVIDNGPASAQADAAGPGKETQIITPPAGDEDDESGFDLSGGKQ